MAKHTQRTDRTRQAIIEAATEMVFGTSRPDEFTMQHVADAAGVSHRTLYRYFPSRQELIDAVGKSYDEQLESSVATEVLDSFDAWVAGADTVLRFGALHRDTFQRTLALAIVSGEWRRDRDEAYWQLFRAEFPNLDEATAREDFAVLRHVLWSSNALLIGQRFDLQPDSVAAAVGRAVDVLVAAIRRRDQAAAG